MSLAGRFALTAARLLQDRADTYAGQALRLAQWGAEQAADRVEAAAPRLATLTGAGLRLTEITCRCMDRLVRHGLDSAQGTLLDGAERLRMTARARSLGTLYAVQLAALPATRRRVAHDLEATWDIVSSASRELADLARATGGELLREPGRQPRAARGRKPRAPPRATGAGKRASRRRTGERRPNT